MKKNKTTGFFAEFKKFISRGNVMDMAVGTIVGAAFTAIVTALSNGILKPVINTIIYYVCGGNADALNKMYTPLVKVWTTVEEEVDGAIVKSQVLDMTKSIYIDWGAFISAIINFLLVAFVLFCIVKTFNTIKDASESSKDIMNRINYKKEKGLKLSKKETQVLEAVSKKVLEEEETAKKEKELEEARLALEQAKIEAREAREANTEKLLTEIRDLLKTNR